jgi:hypothetical protein
MNLKTQKASKINVNRQWWTKALRHTLVDKNFDANKGK